MSGEERGPDQGAGRVIAGLAATGAARHIPVLLREVLHALDPQDGQAFIDGTFGAGGYTRAILESASCRVLALDRDPTAIASGQALVAELAPRLTLVESPFGDLDVVAEQKGFAFADGVVLDIGVSSMQLDEPGRGFSFQHDGPLDMRMSRAGPSAADIINGFEEEQIANLIYEFGEERRSRAIARAIVARRREVSFTRTSDLADLVLRVFHGRKEEGKHPATRTFQALRIFVNDEMGELDRGLRAAERVLKPGGRLVVVTFHSLEDRIVKRFLATRSGKLDHGSRFLPQLAVPVLAPSFRIFNQRPLTPQRDELDVNPRSRSARLRAAVRTDAPVWPTAPETG